MTNLDLAVSYLRQARIRLAVLPRYLEANAPHIVVREAQEIVELSLKAMLRRMGVEPPKWHDVSELLQEHAQALPPALLPRLPELLERSRKLRHEREIAFYGDTDLIPDALYTSGDAEEALASARLAVACAEVVLVGHPPTSLDPAAPDA